LDIRAFGTSGTQFAANPVVGQRQYATDCGSVRPGGIVGSADAEPSMGFSVSSSWKRCLDVENPRPQGYFTAGLFLWQDPWPIGLIAT